MYESNQFCYVIIAIVPCLKTIHCIDIDQIPIFKNNFYFTYTYAMGISYIFTREIKFLVLNKDTNGYEFSV